MNKNVLKPAIKKREGKEEEKERKGGRREK